MANNVISTEALIAKFQYALYNDWGYIWGTAGILWTAARQAQLEKTTDSDRESGRKYGSKWIGHTVADCSGLTDLTIPDQVTEVPEYLLSGCTSLTSLTLPVSIETIGDFALNNCSSLTDVYYAGSEEQAKMLPIGEGNEYLVRAHWHYRMDNEGGLESAVYWSLTGSTLRIYGSGRMPDYSPDYAVPWHARQSVIEHVVVEEGVKNIGDYLFFGCDSLTSVRLPSSLTSIGFNAFYGCESLASVAIPESVTFIGTQAFCGCSGLAQVSLPDGKVTLGESVFEGCRNPCCISMIQLSATAARFPTSAFLLLCA